MKSTTFSKLRNNAKFYFDSVEKGESIEVYRHGKLVAVINPANAKMRQRWHSAKPLKVSGVELSAAILAERKDS